MMPRELSRGAHLVYLATKDRSSGSRGNASSCDDNESVVSSTLDPDREAIADQVGELLTPEKVQRISGIDQAKENDSVSRAIDFDSDCSIEDRTYFPPEISGEEEATIEAEEVAEEVQDITNSDKGKSPKARKRWRKAEPSKWKKNVAKRRKIEKKEPKTVNCISCRFKCSENISQEIRVTICKHFWDCDYTRQKDFILCNVDSVKTERQRLRRETGTPRKDSKKYFLTTASNKYRVCKNFFKNTLAIHSDVIDKAFAHRGEGNIFVGKDMRGQKEPSNKTKLVDVKKVKDHIESFPTMESHYTRKSSKRLYLDSGLSISKMYSLYKEVCINDKSKPVSLITYRRIFCNDYNLSFYKPKKDQCQICARYVSADPESKPKYEDEYNQHVSRKEDCYRAKIEDKQRSVDEKNFMCCTFDLQAVLQIPCSEVSPMYYSRKICTYNLTIYELPTPNDAFCFAWTELNGKRGSSEIGTCLYNYILQLPSHITELSLFSDTCGGQNRNQNISSMFLYLVQTTDLTIIEHKFLESGHSYMEVDSMHSAIESQKKHIAVYTIQDWLNIFRLARSKRVRNKKSSPYNVRELKYSDFKDFAKLSQQTLKNKSKNTEGDRVNWLKIKCFRYQKIKPGILEYRYDHTSEYKEININSGKGRPISLNTVHLSNAYKKLRPISFLKKQNLLTLCKKEAIPAEFHKWYASLPSTKQGKDEIPAPAADDSDDDSVNENDEEN